MDQKKYSLATVDSLYSEAVEGAAAELLGRHDDAVALVADLLNHGSMGMQERLCELLRQRGSGHIADEFSERRWSKFRESLAGLGNFDLDAHRQLLRDLAGRPNAALNHQEATRLDELADFCETMNLNDISAWPRARSKYDEWFWPLAQLVEALGGFESPTIAAQATLTLQRLETVGDTDRAFFYIFDQAHVRDLTAWEQIDDVDDAVRLLVGTFFRGRGAALVAARALWQAPVAELAVPELIHALPQLKPRPELQRIAALTLLSLTSNREVGDWATDPNPVLRKIAAERSPAHDGQAMTSTISRMLSDIDGHVVEAALRRLDPLSVDAKMELERIAAQDNPGWLCLHCNTDNAKGRRSCSQCHVSGPDPAALAAALLNGTARPATVVLDLDDFGDFDD